MLTRLSIYTSSTVKMTYNCFHIVAHLCSPTLMAREPNHKLIPPPDDASSMSPSDARALFRKNGYSGCTAEFCSGYARTNIVILPKKISDDFKKFCEHNSGPLPLLYSSEPGEVGASCLANGSNIR